MNTRFFRCLAVLCGSLLACLQPARRPARRSVEARSASPSRPTRPRQAKPLPDASLADIVKSALVSESSLDAQQDRRREPAGNVALYGTVDTPQQKEKAERIVMSVGGVRSVANNLRSATSPPARGATSR